MGYGDQLMATGMARGAQLRGKKVAFGDRKRIRWDQHSAEIFAGNPNIALPGAERDANVEWVEFYKGCRIYNRQDSARRRWVWNEAFHAIPGEVVFNRAELRNRVRCGKGFVVVEPNVEFWKTAAPNKDWGLAKYQAVADAMMAEGRHVVQFLHPKARDRLARVDHVRTLNFRDGLALLSQAALYIGPEGGLHHGAAAVGRSAVVLFGGFIPPSVTGYDGHINLTGGVEACGRYTPCDHCAKAMRRIDVDQVLAAAKSKLEEPLLHA